MLRKKSNKNPFLSIIIPLYNEEGRLKNLLKIYKYLNKLGLAYEVVIVNDGSQDNTLNELKNFAKKFKFKLISYQKNKGKGAAIKRAMLTATGKYRLFSDVDLSTPIEEFNKFLPFLKNYDVIIGSRRIMGATFKKRQRFLRESLGRGFTMLSKIILELDISDFTCGFKCYSEKAAQKIFALQKINRWGFDSEDLFLAQKLGFQIKEVPVVWTNDPATKVKLPQDLIQSLWDLYKIRYFHSRKNYEQT